MALTLAATTAGTATFAYYLLDRTPDFVPWLRWLVLAGGLGAALVLGVLPRLSDRTARLAAGVALVAALAGPAAYTVSTVSTPHTGSIPSAGPTVAGSAGFGPPGGAAGPGPLGQGTSQRGVPGQGPRALGGPGGAMAGGSPSAGGLLEGSTSTAAITSLLRADASQYTWAAAAVGSNTAAGYQLASQQPVMAVGGFNGSDPSPTLAQFKASVAAGRIHYFIAGSQGGGASLQGTPTGTGRAFVGGSVSPGGQSSSAIAAWVAVNFTAKTVDGVTLYDLSGGLR